MILINLACLLPLASVADEPFCFELGCDSGISAGGHQDSQRGS